MKLKLITLVYICIIGSFSFAEELFFNGGLSASADAGITGFNSRTVKMQPLIAADAFFFINAGNSFKTGLYAGIIYAFSSNLNEGWSYPGFSGMETGLELRMTMPFWKSLDIGAVAAAGWYRYSLTENFFFLPSAVIYPAFRLYESDHTGLFIEFPIRYYFHKQADVFMSAGAKFRVVFK